jgi:lipopolysaccharide export system protein LptC
VSPARWALAFAAATAAGGLGLVLRAADSGNDTRPAAGLPDLYVESLYWESHGPGGRTVRRLRAQRLEQWPDEDTARLIEPRLEIRGDRDRRWLARAERGRLSADGRSLRLEQEVSLRPHPDSGGLRVTAERLHITADGDFVETDAPVVLESGNWHFSAGGLRVDLSRRRVELLDRVEGIHD